jgi:recyclin-1
MEKFATLEPVRLHATPGRFFSKATPSKPSPPRIGRLPSSLHQLVLSYLPIPDIPAYALVSRATHALVQNDKLWELRWNALCIDRHDLGSVLDDLEAAKMEKTSAARAQAPPTLAVENEQDEFGDFAAVDDIVSAPMEEMDDFVGSSSAPSNTRFNLFAASAKPQLSEPPTPSTPSKSKRSLYIRAHTLLQPLTAVLAPTTPPHLVLSSLSTFLTPPSVQSPSSAHTRPQSQSSPTLSSQSKVLQLLAHFLSSPIQPTRAWRTLASALRGALDRFDATLLAAFDVADGTNDEKRMREAAEASWRVWLAGRVGLDVGGGSEDWEMGKVWADKRSIFYEQGRWDALANFMLAPFFFF